MLMQLGYNPYIPTKDRDFFLLLRAGLWQEMEEELSQSPDWSYIYNLACEQTIQGIITDGYYKTAYLGGKYDEQIYNDFLNQSAQIVRNNCLVNNIQAKVCQSLTDLNIDHVILKGQGVAQNYPNPMLRCCGDIDLFFTIENYERSKDVLKPLATKIEDKPFSKECLLTIDGVDVELHGAMTSGINKAADKHLQTILNNVLNEGDTRRCNILGKAVTLPSANFDAIYILTHTIRHLGSFGISLRQVIDWMMHLHANRDIIDRERLQYDLNKMHLQNLWNIFSIFAVEYLGAPKEDFIITKTIQPYSLEEGRREASFLWTIIAQSGSFGHKTPYFKHLHVGRLNERFARIYYHFRQALVLRKLDTEFSNFLLCKELKDIFVSPFRFLFGRKTKI